MFDAQVIAFMTADVTTVSATATVREALELLVARRISGVPAVDQAGRVVGVFSATDAARAVAAGPHRDSEDSFYDPMALLQLVSLERRPEPTELHVAAVMSRTVRSVAPSATMREAAGIMAAHNVHRLVVLDETEHLVGMLSSLDVCRAMAKAPPVAASGGLGEEAGGTVLARAFAARGYAIERNVPFELRVQGGAQKTVHLDGYDAAQRVGFELVTTAAGDRTEFSPDVVDALEGKMARGECFLLLIDETDGLGEAELERVAGRFLDAVAAHRKLAADAVTP